MAHKSLLQMLEEVAGNVRSLEREKSADTAKIQALEREVAELRNVISLAESKVDEMLKAECASDVSVEPPTPKDQVTLPSLPSEELQDVKRRFPRAFGTD